jgi:murein hydrolase activator
MRRAPRNSLFGLVAMAAVTAVQAAPPSKEETTRREMQQAEQARAAQLAAQKDAAERAAQASADEARLTDERIEAAAKLRVLEAATDAAAARMDDLAARRTQAQARLDARAKSMQPLLPLIERLSLFPAETLLAVPAPPEERLRGLIVLQGVSRQLEQEAEALRRDQAELDAATRAIEAEAPKLAAASAAQSAQAERLDQLIAAAHARRRQAEIDAETAAKRAETEAGRAETLRGVLASLEAQRRAEQARARDEEAKAERHKRAADAEAARQRQVALAKPTGAGTLPAGAEPHSQLAVPVAGTVIRSWGEPTDVGPAMGVSYQAAPAARVVAPCTGKVVFADMFRSYGLLLIVDCGGGYHAVLAGLDRLDAKAGQSVRSGEPIGVMPGWEPGVSGRRPSLYVELRRDGQPVNPAPWLKSNS